MFLPSEPPGTSTNQHEPAWTMTAYPYHYLPCLFYNMHRLLQCLVTQLISYKSIQCFSVNMCLQRNVTTKWLTTLKIKHLDEHNSHLKNALRRLHKKYSSSANCRIKWHQNDPKCFYKMNPCWHQKCILLGANVKHSKETWSQGINANLYLYLYIKT